VAGGAWPLGLRSVAGGAWAAVRGRRRLGGGACPLGLRSEAGGAWAARGRLADAGVARTGSVGRANVVTSTVAERVRWSTLAAGSVRP